MMPSPPTTTTSTHHQPHRHHRPHHHRHHHHHHQPADPSAGPPSSVALRPTASAGVSCPSFPPSLISAAAAAAAAAAASSETCPPSPQSLSRRNTLAAGVPFAGDLPLLDFSALSKSTPSATAAAAAAAGSSINNLPGNCGNSIREHVDSISSSLSAVRPYLYVGGLASLIAHSASMLSRTPSSSSSSSVSSTAASASTPAVSLSQQKQQQQKHHHHQHPQRITHIITFTTSVSPQLERYQQQQQLYYHRNLVVSAFPLRDDPQQRIDHVFQPVAHVIDDARSRGGATALVCAQGISRSAACALAYLILREGLTLDEALSDAREARPIIAPNCAFIDALTRLERKVRVGLTNDMFSVVKRVADPEKRQKQRAMAAAARLMKKNQQLYDNDLEPKYDQKMEVSSPKLCAEYFNPSTPRNRNFNLATATLLTYHRPFVAVSAEHHAQIDPGDVLAKVVVVERAHRKGVIVWFGASSDRDVQLAGQRLARMIAKQQVADQERFRDPSGDGEDNNEHMIKDNAFGEAPEVSSRIEVRLQGLHPNFDDRIVQELTECKR